MRILTFTSLFPNQRSPDFGVFIMQRTRHLAAISGNFLEVVAPVPYVPRLLARLPGGSAAKIPQVETISGLRVHYPRYPLIPRLSMPMHAVAMYLGCLSHVRSVHQRHNFECIDAHYIYPDGLAAVLIGRKIGIPVILSARGSDIHTFPQFQTVRPQIRWALRHAAGAIAVSRSLAERMLELEPGLKHVEVIGNGVDQQRFYPEERNQAREKLGWGSGDKIVLCVAALKALKGVDLLVQAGSLLRKDIPNLRVVFVGTGPDLPKLQRLANRLGCAEACHFVGAIPNSELKSYFSAADVACLPSHREGWPNVILEALACGTPVVATRAGAIPDIITTERFGILVEPNADALYQGLRQALQRTWDRPSLASYAGTFSWEAVGQKVQKFLDRTLNVTIEDYNRSLSPARPDLTESH